MWEQEEMDFVLWGTVSSRTFGFTFCIHIPASKNEMETKSQNLWYILGPAERFLDRPSYSNGMYPKEVYFFLPWVGDIFWFPCHHLATWSRSVRLKTSYYRKVFLLTAIIFLDNLAPFSSHATIFLLLSKKWHLSGWGHQLIL